MTTTNLGLTLPSVGADSDVWGDELNTIINAFDALLGGVIYGLTLSAAGGTATFGIATGSASGMTLASAYTKTASAWAVGTGNGSLDTGAIANATWYHVWLIQRPDTGVNDVLTSLSATAPTMPANYTRKRRIGAMKTDGSAQWIKFVQKEDRFEWDTPVQDINTSSLGTSATLNALSTPLGIATVALMRGYISHAGANISLLLSSPLVADAAPNAIAGNLTQITQVGGQSVAFTDQVRTDTSSQIRARAALASTTVVVVTFGWVDPRGK